MIEFFKNLFRINRKQNKPRENIIKHYIREDNIEVFIDKEKGIIRIEAPSDKKLTSEEILEICQKYCEEEL